MEWIEVTVPVPYEVEGTAYQLVAAADNWLVGRDKEGKLSAFSWENGVAAPFVKVSEQELSAAGAYKVRRNFWLRMLTAFWAGEKQPDSVVNAFSADEIDNVFEIRGGKLALKEEIPSLVSVLRRIVEE
ncbi:MAG: hypothetical protein K6G83_09230 [Lachnospiraceae bacterium]|nr:hypothetical protein [Lachnospiraceae bacterium]